ncbi:MAG: hypothetical protein EXR75_05585 [Myxococcales bacterium]|nr:hypothetical protein [Myxococcales bacterium]
MQTMPTAKPSSQALLTASDRALNLGDPRGVRILAKSMYRELRASGLGERDVVAVATELLAQAAVELRESR